MNQKRLEPLLYSTAGVVVMFLIVLALNFVLRPAAIRADLTAEKAHTLSAGTRSILKKIEGPIEFRFYTSKGESADPMMKSYALRIEDLLNEYRREARGKITLKKLDPQPDSEAEDSARLDGVEPETSSRSGEPFYLGLAVSFLDQKVAIPFFTPQRDRLLEYDLSRAISRVGHPDRPVIGVMSGLPIFGQPANPMMMRMGQQGSEPWVFISELQRDFTVKQIEMDSDKIDDEIKVLLVVHPKQIPPKTEFALDQFVLRGGKLVAFLDAFSLLDNKGQQNPMMQQMGGGTSTLERLLKAWGLQFDTSKVVADMTFARELGGQNGRPQLIPTFLFLNQEAINGDEAVTAQMDNILLPFAGAFTGTPSAGLKQTVLLKSSRKSQLVEGFMASMAPEQVAKDFKSADTVYNLALRLEGRFKTAFPEGKPDPPPAEPDKKEGEKKPEPKPETALKDGNEKGVVILVGDSDCIADRFSVQVQNFFGQKIVQPFNGNLTLVQNMVEQLGGDNDLIGARSRASLSRPFTRIKKMEEQAQENFRVKIREMESELAETERKLNELQSMKEGNQKFILSAEQQAELDKFKKKRAETNKELKRVRKQLRHDIDSLEARLKWANIGGVPLLVILAGIGAALWKNKRRK